MDTCGKIPLMPTDQIVPLLIAERDRLDRAIQILQDGGAKRRGRQPKTPTLNPPSVPDAVKPASATTPVHRKRTMSGACFAIALSLSRPSPGIVIPLLTLSRPRSPSRTSSTRRRSPAPDRCPTRASAVFAGCQSGDRSASSGENSGRALAERQLPALIRSISPGPSVADPGTCPRTVSSTPYATELVRARTTLSPSSLAAPAPAGPRRPRIRRV